MQDIFENKDFFLGNPVETLSFFYVFLLIFMFFLGKYFLKKYKNKTQKIEKVEKIDFFEKLEKINEKNFLNDFFSLYIEFLEEKTGKKNISKMTFSELKKISLQENLKDFYEKIYFLKFENKILDEKEIGILKENFRKILKYNS